MTQFTFYLSLALCAVASGDSPFEKVLQTIKKIKHNVEEEGKKESVAFSEFACWCKQNNRNLENMVNEFSDKISLTSATISTDTMDAKNLRSTRTKDLGNADEMERKRNVYQQKLNEENTEYRSIKSEYTSNNDLVDKAIRALKESRGRANSGSLLQVPEVNEFVAIADAMGLIKSPKQKSIAAALLQGGPRESYNYHGGSNEIIDLVVDLKEQATKIFNDRQSEHEKAVTSYKEMIKSLSRGQTFKEKHAQDALEGAEKRKARIGTTRGDLVESQAELEDTDRVLKEVTAVCESRAKEYDARASMRMDELIALKGAIAHLTDAYASSENQARALLQSQPDSKKIESAKPKPAAKTAGKAVAKDKAVAATTAVKDTVPAKPLSFLQETKSHGFLKSNADEENKKKALELLQSEGDRVNSVVLKSIVATARSDPFDKVKQLVEKLINRLTQEALQETSKKGFCDTEVAKAEEDRDMRFSDAKELATELQGLKAVADAKILAVSVDNKAIKESSGSLNSITSQQDKAKKALSEALKEQKEGYAEVQEAVRILTSFYGRAAEAAKTAAFVQRPTSAEQREQSSEDSAKHQAGHIGDVPAVERLGTRKDGIKAVFDLLETVNSDFERQIRMLESGLEKGRAETEEATESLKAQLEHFEEDRKLNQQDLDTTNLKIASSKDDLQEAMNLLDTALKQLETLKPTCMDTGMSYSERVKKREAEIKALGKALQWLH